ncbi:restriction endonuclease subunit S [Soehngenia longivitae]|uniref:restriction endonuclease subunit S n=1 Tax=Soehngenia longivitae TaxID=2562294 RepID=UPI001ADE8B85
MTYHCRRTKASLLLYISNRTGETIVVSSSGANAGYVSYWDKPIFMSDAFTIQPKSGYVLNIKYLFYYLKMDKYKFIHFKKVEEYFMYIVKMWVH